MAVQVSYNSWYISLMSSAKRQREMNKFCVVWKTWKFLNFYLKFIAVYQIQFRDSFDSYKQRKWLKSRCCPRRRPRCFLNSLLSRVSHVRTFIREFEKFCMADHFNLCVNFKMASRSGNLRSECILATRVLWSILTAKKKP